MLNDQLFDKQYFIDAITKVLYEDMDTSPEKASDDQFYRATATVLRNILSNKRKRFMAAENSQGHKQVYYLSMEFLMGRSLKNTIYNEGLVDAVSGATDTCYAITAGVNKALYIISHLDAEDLQFAEGAV